MKIYKFRCDNLVLKPTIPLCYFFLTESIWWSGKRFSYWHNFLLIFLEIFLSKLRQKHIKKSKYWVSLNNILPDINTINCKATQTAILEPLFNSRNREMMLLQTLQKLLLINMLIKRTFCFKSNIQMGLKLYDIKILKSICEEFLDKKLYDCRGGKTHF